MLLGSIISPTDPIAVLAILNKAGISESLKLRIEGEALFNDGFGVVVFTILFALIEHNIQGSILQEVGMIIIHEVFGGLFLGFVLGLITKRLLMLVSDDAELSVMITIATIIGGYAIAHSIGVSGLLAIVIFGLFMGHFFQRQRISRCIKI